MIYGAEDQLGQFKFIKKAAKGVAKGVGKVAKGAAKVTVNIAALPAKLALEAGIKAAGVICKAPPAITAIAAQAAGVNPNTVPLFCQAVRVRNMNQVKALLPPLIKIAVQLGATGAFPPIGPVITVLKLIPGVKFAGAGEELGAAVSPIDLLGAMSLGEIEIGLGMFSDAEIASNLGAVSVPLGLYVGALGLMSAAALWVVLAQPRRARRRR